MLKNWSSHADYQQFIISNLSCLYKDFPKKVIQLESSISKLYCLDLDILREILKPYYSNIGRPATLQPEIFRSFSLMLFQKETSITNWVKKLHASDGTCVHCKSSYYGSKVCDCRKNGIYDCKCPRRLSDINANWGWDSHENRWFYGYTLYALSSYNKKYKIDLPIYLRFVEASRHDSVTGIVALAEFRELLPQFNISNYVLDSANDNYPTYELCSKWNINPFIDLNSKNKGNSKYPTTLDINEKGVPICIDGHEMVYDGFEKSRSRLKWRCPLVLKKVDSCSCCEQCSPSPYGRVIYTKPSWDLRLFTSVPRGTKQWKTIYKTRTCSERINNRILNDYKIHSLRIHGKKRYSFMTMIAGINIHLDARLKVSGFSILNLLE
jgi:hypothetical protein